jgi:hypothetical protein
LASDNNKLTASPIILGINKEGYKSMLTLSEFLDEDVVKAIMSLSDNEFLKHLNDFTNKKSKALEAGRTNE